jgi:uncharacterized membrane protein YkoI
MSKKRLVMASLVMGVLVIVGGLVWSAEQEKKRGAEHAQAIAAEHAQALAIARDFTVTIDQAIKTALENFPGKVIEAGLEARYGTVVWEVDIVMADGEVKVIHIDAASGGVINTEDHVAG